MRISWRRDYRERTLCDDGVIDREDLIGPEDAGYIMCITENCGSEDNIGSLDFICTDYSIDDNWASGLLKRVHTFPGPGVYQTRLGLFFHIPSSTTYINDSIIIILRLQVS